MIKHFCAANDVNGNPQRCYVLVDEDGRNLAAWDEGYLGDHAVPGIWRREAYAAERIDCSMRWYRKMLRTLPSPAYACDLPGYSHLRSAV
jgi:hypothetical protein